MSKLRTMFLRLIALSFAVFMLTPCASNRVLAQSVAPDGVFKDWSVFRIDDDTSPICYALSTPKRSAPANVNRGNIFITISNHQNDNIRHEVSVRIGYHFSPKSRPFARIGNRNFQFFTNTEKSGETATRAWLKELDQHGKLLKAMRNGVELTFKGTSSRGTLTTDHYSLLGLSDALKKIDELCK